MAFVALAQRRYAYIYDASGAEVHKLKHHVDPLALAFLP
jgi:U3 small nucleolar RNA-associated protein 7